MTKIKICGLKNFEDALYAHNMGADALGFVVGVEALSKRNISKRYAKDIIENLPPFALSVSVTVYESYSKTKDIMKKTNADILQLHGDVDLEIISKLRRKINSPLIYCYSIDQNTKADQAIFEIEKYVESKVDTILLDTKGKKGAGGTGKIHNWDLSSDICRSFEIPFILAGGINTDNVLDAIDKVEPYAVDVSSGVEIKPGIKDRKKISEIIENVRS